jgi:CO dehydrogenase/acetyl-CoA synthase alpha subunit
MTVPSVIKIAVPAPVNPPNGERAVRICHVPLAVCGNSTYGTFETGAAKGGSCGTTAASGRRAGATAPGAGFAAAALAPAARHAIKETLKSDLIQKHLGTSRLVTTVWAGLFVVR